MKISLECFLPLISPWKLNANIVTIISMCKVQILAVVRKFQRLYSPITWVLWPECNFSIPLSLVNLYLQCSSVHVVKLCHNLPRVCNVAKISLLLRALTRHFLIFDCSPFKPFCINAYHTEYQLERRGKN